jgi:hypothetical protein
MTNREKIIRKITSYEQIVCFGVGKQFRKFETFFMENNLDITLSFCVDNNEMLHGEKILFAEKEVEVLPVDCLKNINKSTTLLIICVNVKEAMEQLQREKQFQGIEYFAYSWIPGLLGDDSAMSKRVPQNLHVCEEQKIPKIIHYCWFGGQEIPEKNRRWMESWKRFCPDYEIMEWNESNYDVIKNEYMYEAYQAKKWGFVPDYARLDIICKYGGIYLDTDVELVANLDDLLYQHAFAGVERWSAGMHVNLGLGFGAERDSKIMKELLKDYTDRHFIKEDGSLDLTTSPSIQTENLLKKGLQLNGEYQVLQDGVTIYPEKMFSSKSLSTRIIETSDYTKSIHHYDASWDDNMGNKKRREYLEQLGKVIWCSKI